MNRAQLKANAKAQLGGQLFSQQWMMALALCLIHGAVTALAGALGLGIGAVIVVGPLTVSLCGSFLAQTRYAREMQIEDLFAAFKRDFGGSLLLALMQTIFVFLWSLLLVIPGIIKAYSYSQCFYIKADHPDWDWQQCLNESTRIMQGHKMQLFVLDLSFIGWYIVGAMLLAIGTLWVVPYHNAAKSQFYEALTNETGAVY